VTLRALVVGDRFIPATLFGDALRAAAQHHGLELDVATLALPYPSADRLPLPSEVAAEFRPMWELPAEMSSRAAADLAADPTIREYSGPVDLLLPHVADIDVLLVHLAPVSRAVIAAAPRLRAVGCARGGPVNVNVPSLSTRGIPVFNCPGRNSRAVAEFLIGAIIAQTRGIIAGARALGDGDWRIGLYASEHVGHELYGRTCGLIGFGAVGHAFAPIARGLGLRLVVHDPYVADADLAAADAERVSLDELLSTSHIVLTLARLTDETRSMIGARELGLLQPNALFVNTARAEIVDGEALRAAVARGLRVVVDVFNPEPPLASDPLVRAENALLTPHIAGASREAAARGARGVAEAVTAFLATGAVTNCVNATAVTGPTV
jgi:D-3-phosphoglycerate dehydrogenase